MELKRQVGRAAPEEGTSSVDWVRVGLDRGKQQKKRLERRLRNLLVRRWIRKGLEMVKETLAVGEGRAKWGIDGEGVGGVREWSMTSLESPLGSSGPSPTPPQSPTRRRGLQLQLQLQ